MNIFVLDTDPVKAAQYHCDTHVRKMLIEYCQLLSTASYNLPEIPDMEPHDPFNLGTAGVGFYKPYQPNHPCSKWLNPLIVDKLGADPNVHKTNIRYLLRLLEALVDEFRYRWPDKKHKSIPVALEIIRVYTNAGYMNSHWGEPKTFAVAMPEEYYFAPLWYNFAAVPEDYVQSYRNYYKCEKLKLLTYTRRQKPDWLGSSGETK